MVKLIKTHKSGRKIRGISSGAADVAETSRSVQAIHVNNLVNIIVLVKFSIAFICLTLNSNAEVAFGCDVMI